MFHVFLVWPWIFEILNSFYLIWPFIPWKKVGPPLTRVEKKMSSKWVYRVSKEAELCADFKNVQKSWVWQKEKKIFTEKLNFFGLGKFCKNLFFREKIFGNFLMQEFYTFLKSAQNSASFDTLCVNSSKGRFCFFGS
jgi:hypothetical protein